jgi:hypothetical protein
LTQALCLSVCLAEFFRNLSVYSHTNCPEG